MQVKRRVSSNRANLWGFYFYSTVQMVIDNCLLKETDSEPTIHDLYTLVTAED